MKKMTDKQGMVIISILMVTVVLLIMTTSMLIIHSSTLGFITLYEKQTVARKLAESGVAYALYSLRNDSQWGKVPGDPNFIGIIDVPEVNGQFKITFNNAEDNYSYYNIEDAAKDPNYGYKNSGVPGYSMDLIVEGIANPGSGQVSKKYRAILQADSFYDGALTSGSLKATANSITVRNEGDDANSPPLPGSIHSNSVLGMIDPNTHLPITNGMSNYAIDPVGSTTFDLYGGVLSAQGDINPSITVDPNTQRNPGSRARHMKPVDITGAINDAVASSTIPEVGGSTYVVGKNSLVSPGDANTPVTLPGLTSADYEVTNGKLIIKKDVVFNNDVRFEFAYDKITEGIDPDDTGAIKSAVKNAGIYMGDGTGSAPSVYVKNGDLTVAGGTVKGNGSFYVDGKASYIGESNLVASGQAGVAVLANKDVNLSLPQAPTAQTIDMTGLVYSAGNANIELFNPGDTTDPINNLSSSGKWPSTWDFDYEEAVSGSGGGGGGGGGVEPTFAAHTGDRIRTNKTGPPPEYITYEIYGTDDASITNTGASKWDPDRTTILSANSSTETRLTVYTGPSNSPAGPWTLIYQKILTPGEQIIFDKTNSAGIPGVIDAGTFRAAIYSNPLNNDLPGTEALPSITPTGTKVPPNFKFTGALVAIDPNNPVPSPGKQDDPNAGNINIDIGGGNLDITCSSKYLQLLRVVKAGTIFRVVSWTEL
ncbi:MAG: hypothetical protein ABRQ39_22835 [Candidatus Eremiobacterota bacterium]